LFLLLACSLDQAEGDDDAPAAGSSSGGKGGAAAGSAGTSSGSGGTLPSSGGSGTSGKANGGSSGSGTSGSSSGMPGAGAGGKGSAGAGGAGGAAGGAAGGLGGALGGAGKGGSSAGGLGGGAGKGGASSGGAAGTGGSATAGASGSAGAAGKAGFEPCPTNGDPCKILPFGDSITDGVGMTGGGGYRVELFRKALAADQSITFVGAQMNGPQMVENVPFPRRHEGHSGWRIAQLGPLIPDPAFEDLPHIVLLHIGTNDIAQNDNLSGAPGRLETLIDQIIAAAPDALVVVAKLIPLNFGSGGSAVGTYNDAIPAIVEERAQAGKHVIMVDQNTGFPLSELPDNVHPNEAGYVRMAGVWYEAIKGYLR
jgi:lysophospholipase L1-like esterase